MFASQNYHETRPSQPKAPHFTNEKRSSTLKLGFSPDLTSQQSTAAFFGDYSTLPGPHLASYGEVDSFLVPRTSDGGSLDLFDFDSEPQRSLVDSIARFGVEEVLDVNRPSPELMPATAEPWTLATLTPKSASRLSHHRESSLSSLGSAGPASPYTQTTSNPHITVVDSTNDNYHDLHGHDNYYHLSKGGTPLHETYYSGYHELGQSQDAHLGSRRVAALPTHKLDRGLLVASDFAFGSGASHPSVSVASSAASDSPATPSLEMPGDERRRRADAFNKPMPTFERTMTEVYADELLNPDGLNSMGAPSSANRIPSVPTNTVFADRLNAVNHLNANHSPTSTHSRERSPFRNGSPLAPMASHDFHGNGMGGFRSAQQMREQTKMEQDAHAYRQQVARAPRTDAPKTISPKDAILEFQEPEGGSNFPLFPSQGAMHYDMGVSQAPMAYDTPATTASLGHATQAYSYMAPHLHPSLPVLQQYPFAPQHRSSESRQAPGLVPRLGHTDPVSRDSNNGGLLQKAPGAGNDGATYTCTYHGCTLRFETPALLQKHKREGHRQAHGLNNTRRPDTGATSLLNSQAGPHRCDRINPSTGKPCATIFSRPYDLTRHEDTIHNIKKMKVRCPVCQEEKTFSRADALTRHFRVCHPEVEVPGKHRRRAAAAK